jgi:hypothetical protein
VAKSCPSGNMGLLGTLAEALETKGLEDAVLRVKGGFSVLPSAELRSYMCSQLQGKGDAMLALDEWSEPPFNGFVDVDSAGEAAWMEDACTELAAALLDETEALRRCMRWTVGGCAVPCASFPRIEELVGGNGLLQAGRRQELSARGPRRRTRVRRDWGGRPAGAARTGPRTARAAGRCGPGSLRRAEHPARAPPPAHEQQEQDFPLLPAPARAAHEHADAAPGPLRHPPVPRRLARMGKRRGSSLSASCHASWQMHGATRACILHCCSNQPGIRMCDLPENYKLHADTRLAQLQHRLPDEHPVASYAGLLANHLSNELL